ncbi:MAG: glycosyltransferase family 39 protein [bacterium]
MSQAPSILDRGPDPKKMWLFGLLVFACALATRLALLASLPQSISYDVTIQEGSDTHRFFVWALSISEKGDLVGQGVYNQSPLYPYFLALIFELTGGGNLVIPRLVQAFIGSLTAVVVFLFGVRLRSYAAGVLGGLLIAFYGPLLMYDTAFLRTSILTFINVLLLYQLARARTAPSGGKGLFIGILFGLAILAKPNILIMLPALAWWIMDARKVSRGERRGPFSAQDKITWMPRPSAWRALVVWTVIGFVAVMSVLAARNIKAGVSPFALTRRGALEFIAGNHPEVDVYGWDVTPSVYRIKKECQNSLLKSVPAVVGIYGDNPQDLVIRQFKKFWVLLNWFAAHEINYYMEKHYLSILKLPWINWPVLLGFALCGMFFVLKSRRRYFELYSYLLLYTLVTVAFYVNIRFRVPLVPALAVFAGVALESMYDFARKKRWKSLAPALVFVIATAVILWPRPDEPLGPNDYHNLVRYHLIKEEPEKAEKWHQKGLEHSRELVREQGDARSHYLVARMLFLGGEPLERVEKELEKAESIEHGPPLQARIEELRKAIQRRKTVEDELWKGYRI